MKIDTHNSFDLRLSSISDMNRLLSITIDFIDYRISSIGHAGINDIYFIYSYCGDLSQRRGECSNMRSSFEIEIGRDLISLIRERSSS